MNEARPLSAAHRIPPPKPRIKNHWPSTKKLWNQAAADTVKILGNLAANSTGSSTFAKILSGKSHSPNGSVGGKTNASYNCLDVHLNSATAQQSRYHLGRRTGRAANSDLPRTAPRGLQVCCRAQIAWIKSRRRRFDLYANDAGTGHRYVGLCRIGVVHSVIFGGFSSEAIADRNNDAKAKTLITADAGWRRGQQLPLKANVDAALAKSPTVKNCIVLRRVGIPIDMQAGRDHWWHELLSAAPADCPAEPLDSEAPPIHPLYQRQHRKT